MRLIIVLAVVLLSSTQCSRKMYGDVPSCLRQKIDEIRSKPVGNPPVKISEYDYNGQRVYLLTKPCCDQYNELYDANCNYLCAPSGGLTGKGDGKCPDFEMNAKFVKVVWEDKRS